MLPQNLEILNIKVQRNSSLFLFSHDATAPSWPGPAHDRNFTITPG